MPTYALYGGTWLGNYNKLKYRPRYNTSRLGSEIRFNLYEQHARLIMNVAMQLQLYCNLEYNPAAAAAAEPCKDGISIRFTLYLVVNEKRLQLLRYAALDPIRIISLASICMSMNYTGSSTYRYFMYIYSILSTIIIDRN